MIYFRKRGNIRKRGRWNRRLRLLSTLSIGVSWKFHLHFILFLYVLAKILQNGAKFIQELTPGFKNPIRNLENFRQAVESPKIWNSMHYVCPKNTFLQLKHIQMIYPTLLLTTCVKIHQTPYVIFKTKTIFLDATLLYHFISNITKVAHPSANL